MRAHGIDHQSNSSGYNQTLSTIRARRVASYLAAQGIGSERFTVEGFGVTKPIASNKTKSGRAKNRRVEIEIIPIR
jgi:outer membrane protein OmpA-like peptidoglycan-associated protein